MMIEVIYDRSWTSCPKCLLDDAIVALHVARLPGRRQTEKFCRFHGQITGVVHREEERARSKDGNAPDF